MTGSKDFTTSLYVRSILFGTALMFFLTTEVSGHGRLVEPPSRSSMWRFGFKTKPNYNDNELFCGGYTVHWQRNKGKCGICGDAWHLPTPRPNEAGGVYGQGVIVRTYKPGQVIKSTVDITANHRGFFEFKLCPHNNPKVVATQECLDRYPLELADGSGTQYFVPRGTGPFNVQLKLPERLTCSQCVFQWTYTAGNNWGTCSNGTSRVGCGPQETFRGCADVAIDESASNEVPSYDVAKPVNFGPSISAIPPRRTPSKPKFRPRPTKASRRKPTRKYYHPKPSWKPASPTRKPIPKRPPFYNNYTPKRFTTTKRTTPYPRYTKPSYRKKYPNKKLRPTYAPKTTSKRTYVESENGVITCEAVGAWQNVAGIAKWCESVCPRGYCPPSHCKCNNRK